jgi:prolyl-tRNA synthetase
MKQSHLFTKTRKEAPADEVSKNAQLLIRAGFIHKEMAGVYSFLPLGLRVVENIKTIIREEMNAIGGEELIMTALQRKELWEKTDRWSDTNVDVWFKSKLKNETEIGFGWSHEEPITDMMKDYVSSFRDLPIYVYQFQTKLRNELRAKSGIMRGREFIMKDLYSYSLDEKSHQQFYDQAIKAYMNIFKRVGIGADTFITFASGGAFTQFSHEFQTITDGGEDSIYINREKNIAINEEVFNEETLEKIGLKKESFEKVATAEVGNIFNFGTKKCEQLNLFYTDSEGKKIPVWLGSYGIGITRLMGVIVEKFSDEEGIVWPEGIAPFHVHLIGLFDKEGKVKMVADALYEKLTKLVNGTNSVEVLYDDRDLRAGEKFADSDLIGIPLRIIVSEKNLAAHAVDGSKGVFEIKYRKGGKSGEVKKVSEEELLKMLA